MSNRVVILCVDDSKASLRSLEWTLDEFHRDGDLIHVLHVVPGDKTNQNTEVSLDDKESVFLKNEFVPLLKAKNAVYELEILHYSAGPEQIGSLICKRAEEVNPAAVIMAKHNRGAIKELFIGSVTTYCTTHLKSPLIVLHKDK